jgi:hypothetical protein
MTPMNDVGESRRELGAVIVKSLNDRESDVSFDFEGKSSRRQVVVSMNRLWKAHSGFLGESKLQLRRKEKG